MKALAERQIYDTFPHTIGQKFY